MEQPGCESYGSAGLTDDAGIHRHLPHGVTDLGFADRYDVIDVRADVLEVDGPDRLRAQTVGQCAGDAIGRQFDNLTFAETLLGVVGQLRLNADDLRLRPAQLDCRRDSTDQATAA